MHITHAYTNTISSRICSHTLREFRHWILCINDVIYHTLYSIVVVQFHDNAVPEWRMMMDGATYYRVCCLQSLAGVLGASRVRRKGHPKCERARAHVKDYSSISFDCCACTGLRLWQRCRQCVCIYVFANTIVFGVRCSVCNNRE